MRGQQLSFPLTFTKFSALSSATLVPESGWHGLNRWTTEKMDGLNNWVNGGAPTWQERQRASAETSQVWTRLMDCLLLTSPGGLCSRLPARPCSSCSLGNLGLAGQSPRQPVLSMRIGRRPLEVPPDVKFPSFLVLSRSYILAQTGSGFFRYLAAAKYSWELLIWKDRSVGRSTPKVTNIDISS